jgi:hypothetical protein
MYDMLVMIAIVEAFPLILDHHHFGEGLTRWATQGTPSFLLRHTRLVKSAGD